MSQGVEDLSKPFPWRAAKLPHSEAKFVRVVSDRRYPGLLGQWVFNSEGRWEGAGGGPFGLLMVRNETDPKIVMDKLDKLTESALVRYHHGQQADA